MKKILYFFGLVSLAFSCKSGSTYKGYDLDLRNSLQIEAKKGEVIEMKMTSNPTTGFDWYSNYDEVNPYIEMQSTFENIEKNAEMVGAPSYKMYKIKGLQSGQYTLQFEYKRSWESTEKPIQTKTVQLIIK